MSRIHVDIHAIIFSYLMIMTIMVHAITVITLIVITIIIITMMIHAIHVVFLVGFMCMFEVA